MQSTDSIEIYAHGSSKNLLNEKEEIKCINIIKLSKKWLTLLCDKKNLKELNSNWSRIHEHPYKILITGGSGSGKNKFIIRFNKSATIYW